MKRQSQHPLRCEALADRIVPALNISFSAGILTVTGDGANDQIVVRSLAANGAIQVNGVNTGHTLSDTFGLVVDGNGGNDNIDASGLNTSFFSNIPNLDGGAGNDTVIGTNSKDILTGGAGNDSMSGLAGDDLIDGGLDNDTLSGGLGNDLFIGGDGTNDKLFESANVNFSLTSATLTGLGNDQVGGIEAAQLTGGAGNNNINAAAFNGRATLDGGAGNDTLIGGTNDDVLNGAAGNDSLVGNGGNDTLFGSSGNDTMNGGAGTDRATLNGNVTLADTFIIANAQLSGASGTDPLTAIEEVEARGIGGNDTFNLSGFTGVGIIDGGDGIDQIVSTIPGNATLTTTEFNRTGAGTVSLAGVERAVLTGDTSNNTINAGGFAGNVTLRGGLGNDVLTGGISNALMDGEAGDDLLEGGNALDTLIGGVGDDSLNGGGGNDNIQGGIGTDRFIANVTANGNLTKTQFVGQGTDTLDNIERATIAGNDGNNSIAATQFDNPVVLNGGNGNDTLFGSSKNDILNGGGDNDVLDGNDGDDTLNGGAGEDKVDTTDDADFTLSDTALTINLVGLGGNSTDSLTSIELADLTGGNGNNELDAVGFTGNVTLRGGNGNDTIFGTNNDDSLVGGAGNDDVFGRGGSDSIQGNAGNDELDGGSGNDELSGGAGVDTIDGSTGTDKFVENFTTATNKTFSMSNTATVITDNGVNQGNDAISNLELVAISMTAGNNAVFLGGFTGSATVTGGSGNDRIAGAQLDDVLNGGAGFDIVRVITNNDVTLTDTQMIGEGTDSLTSFEAADLEGQGAAQTFDATAFTKPTTLRGGGGNDTLKGGTVRDDLFGDAGTDRLEGNNGNDFLTGGAGNDTLLGGNGNDSADSDFGDFVDLGAGEGDGIVIQGTDGADTIKVAREVDANGAVAVVTMNGQEIRFNYIQGETITIFGHGGNDKIELDASMTGFWRGVLYGGDGNDTLTGAGGDDFLNGGAGNDLLDGKDGADVLIGFSGTDKLIGGGGADSIQSRDGQVDLLTVDGLDTIDRDVFDPKTVV